ncbi:DUF3619 family protein [Massilia sp. Root335]|jgi:hypothetical protein|uniref:DUF3619 family protein n=1 Tax=Massilia sp. Root335 TaxID=1736517 RepID=UPI0006F50B8B|nr:DUF3619 family protein [Massilia sp. Root335]KQV45171.1 hypothetical protein ASC93_01070 [Massilia sp. Root335]
MNTDDINLAYKIRHALNENLDNLPASTTDRLAAARAQALARKKADAPARARAPQRAAFDLGALFSMQWVARAAVVAPLLAMVAGMVGVYQYEREQRVAELAELDAAVLSDDLPLTAYTDHGFNAYLAQQQQAQQQPQRAQ